MKKKWRRGSAGRLYLFFTSAQNFSSNLFSSAVSYSSISKDIRFPLHHTFHILNQKDVLFAVLVFFYTISQSFYCIVSGQSKPFLI